MPRVTGKPYYAYVLWSPTGKRFYIGISENRQQRLDQQNDGVFRWTTPYRPWELVHEEKYEDYRHARIREIELKKQKGGQNFFKTTGLSLQHSRPSGS